jgi:hypothetical protein
MQGKRLADDATAIATDSQDGVAVSSPGHLVGDAAVAEFERVALVAYVCLLEHGLPVELQTDSTGRFTSIGFATDHYFVAWPKTTMENPRAAMLVEGYPVWSFHTQGPPSDSLQHDLRDSDARLFPVCL